MGGYFEDEFMENMDLNTAIKRMDSMMAKSSTKKIFSVVVSYRTTELQDKLYEEGEDDF